MTARSVMKRRGRKRARHSLVDFRTGVAVVRPAPVPESQNATLSPQLIGRERLDRLTGPVALKRRGGDEKPRALAPPPPTIGSLREQVAATADLSKVPRGRGPPNPSAQPRLDINQSAWLFLEGTSIFASTFTMERQFGVHSEVGKLRTVLVCRPGLAHQRLTPGNCRDLLFDDVLWVHEARKDHFDFVLKMRERGIEVLELHELLGQTLESTEARRWLLDRRITPNSVGRVTAMAIRPWLDAMPAPALARGGDGKEGRHRRPERSEIHPSGRGRDHHFDCVLGDPLVAITRRFGFAEPVLALTEGDDKWPWMRRTRHSAC